MERKEGLCVSSPPAPGPLRVTAQFRTGRCADKTERSPRRRRGAARAQAAASSGTREVRVLQKDLPQRQKAGPTAETGQEGLAEEGRVSAPCSPHPESNSDHLQQDFFFFF